MDQKTTFPSITQLRQEAASAARESLAKQREDGTYNTSEARSLSAKIATFIDRFGQAERVSTITVDRVGTLISHGRTLLEHRRARADDGDKVAAGDVAALEIALDAIETVAERLFPEAKVVTTGHERLFGPHTPAPRGLNFARNLGTVSNGVRGTTRKLPLAPAGSLSITAVKSFYPNRMHSTIDTYFDPLLKVAEEHPGKNCTVESQGLQLSGGLYSMGATPATVYLEKASFDDVLRPQLDALVAEYEAARQQRAEAKAQKQPGIKLENHTSFTSALNGSSASSYGQTMYGKLNDALGEAATHERSRDESGNYTLAFAADGSDFTIKAQYHPTREGWVMIDNGSLQVLEEWRQAEHAASGSKGSRYWQEKRGTTKEQGASRG